MLEICVKEAARAAAGSAGCLFVVRDQRLLRSARGVLLELWLPLVAVLAVALVRCGFPAPEACALACGEDGACPGGFECQAETNLCAPRGQATPCTLRDRLPNQPPGGSSDTDAGTGSAGVGGAGGTGNAPEPDSGVAGSHTAGASGSGGVPNGPGNPDALAIIVDVAPGESCTGVELSRSLRASGGTSPHAWRLLDAPPGVWLSDASGETSSLSGVADEPGLVRVALEDAAGDVAIAEVAFVHQTPEVETPSLPVYCAGASYAAELLAGGGDGDYTWSAELLSGSGQPGTLAELGLEVGGSLLAGELEESHEELGPFRLLVSARDAHCSSEQVELELDVEPADSALCPSIVVVDAAFDELPPACLGGVYAGALDADGGEPPYSWTELSAPPGLYLDPDSGAVGGVAEGDGVLTVALTDGLARTVRRSFSVEARDACWLAYVTSEPWPARLELVDGRLLEQDPDAARRTLPAVASVDPVQDFEFSPDGRFIAYRLGTDVQRLELARMSDGLGSELDFAGSVAAYAWSEDGSVLAVALTNGADISLGGYDVATSRPLPELGVPSIDSPLLWFGPGRLAFLSRDPALPSRRRLVTLARGADGFEAAFIRTELGFSDGARLRAQAGGVFVAEPETGSHHFFRGDGAPPVLHGEDVVPGTIGAWVGAARSGALQVFRAAGASGPAALPFLGAPGCTTLVGWASARNRIACLDTRAGQNAVVVFDLVSSALGPSLLELGPLVAPYVYPVGVHAGRRRAFSGGGRWFAFTTDEAAYVARLDAARPELGFSLPSTTLGVRPGVLLFSPDERFLMLGAGNTLGVLGLEPAAALRVLSASAVFDETCSERVADAGSGWCGSESGLPDLAWSPGSDLVSFRSALGTLQLVDMSHARAGFVPAPVSPDGVCSEACRSAQTARFQP
jgi:WD40 repeat protein